MLALLVLMLAADGAAPPEPLGEHALSAAELIARGEGELADLEYEQAAEYFMRAASAPDATDEQRLRAHLKAGIANRVIGRDVDARMNFRAVLLADPNTRLPKDTPPKVLAFFESVRQEVELERKQARGTPPPPPDPTTDAVSPVMRGLIAGGIAGGVGLLTLPICAFCGQGLCLLCPGTLIAGFAGFLGAAVVALMGDQSLSASAIAIGAATAAAVLVTALVGGATLTVMTFALPSTNDTLGNGALSPLAQGLTTGAGVAAAVLTGVAAGGIVWVLAPKETATTKPKGTERDNATAMAF